MPLMATMIMMVHMMVEIMSKRLLDLYMMMVTIFIVEMMVEMSLRLLDLCMKFRIICFHSFCLSSGATSYFHFVSAQ